MRTAGARTSAPALLPSPDWVQTFLHSIKIKPIVKPCKGSCIRECSSSSLPPFFKCFKFYNRPLTGACDPLFRAVDAGTPSSPRSFLPRRPLRHAGSAQPQQLRQPAPGPPAPGAVPGASAAALPTACSPGGATAGARGPRSPALTLCRNSRATRRSMVRGAAGARVRAVRGAAAPARPRPRAVGGAPAAGARHRLQHPRPHPPPIPVLAALAVQAAGYR